MKKFVLFIAVLALLASCGTGRHLLPAESSRDSTHVEIRWKTEYVHDTVTVSIPVQEKERTTLEATSHLETDFAESDASIDTLGALHHSIRNKPQDYPVPTQTPVHSRDSIIYRGREVKVPEPYPVEVEVPRELSWFQKTQMIGFWAIIALLAVKYRKKIWSFVARRLI